MATREERAQQKIERLKEQQAKLANEMKAAKLQASKAKRTRDNKRKLLIGALMLDRLERGDCKYSGQEIKQMLDEFLTRPTDRAVFDLEDSQQETKAQEQPKEEASGRIYLQVPYDEKDEMKKLGGSFDSAKKQWYLDTPSQEILNQALSKWHKA